MQEVSFLSGLTLRKQREFVMNSITAVHKIHKPLGVSKVFLLEITLFYCLNTFS